METFTNIISGGIHLGYENRSHSGEKAFFGRARRGNGASRLFAVLLLAALQISFFMIVFFRTKALSVYRRVSVSLTVPFSFRCEIPPAFAAFGIVGYNGHEKKRS